MYINRALIVFPIVMFFASNAQAYVFHVDDFSISTNDSAFFSDGFDDGAPPPSAPNLSSGAPISYFVKGTMGPESGGKLTLNSSGAELGTTALGDPMLFQSALLKTGIGTTAMLKNTESITIQAIFDLTLPSVDKESYGINFTDSATGQGIIGNDAVGIRVIDTISGINIQFFEASRFDQTFNPLSSVLLDQSPHDQIMLSVNYDASLSINAVTAAYAYVDGGTMGTINSMSGSTDIFNGEDWTRAQLVARTVVPVPVSIWLFGSGLVGLIAVARRKKA
jgi:hypothetical protein